MNFIKHIPKTLGFFVFFVFFYIVIFGGLVFKVYQPAPTDLTYDIETLRTPSEETTYAYLVEARNDALNIRLALIENAEVRIDVSYYSVHPNESRDIFYGALLAAADRGVSVRFIIDGFIEGGLYGDQSVVDALASHENITFKYYEPFQFLRMYAFNNRLHDKLVIVDGQYGLMGGRNIGDRYFMDLDEDSKMVHDRDILIFGEVGHSTIMSMHAYYDELFESDYAHAHLYQERLDQDTTRLHLLDAYYTYISALDLTERLEAIHEEAVLVERASFLRSPLNRMHKEPVVFNTIIDLAMHYDTLYVQSPYIIIDETMAALFEPLKNHEITVLTNNYIDNPNLWAVSGYMRSRNHVAQHTNLYEYHGDIGIHSKTMMMGNEITIIGSSNIDPRSAFLSTESMMVVYSPDFYDYVDGVIASYLEESLLVESDGSYAPHETIDPREETFSRKVERYITTLFTWFFEELL